MSQDHATALWPRQQSEIPSQGKKKKIIDTYVFIFIFIFLETGSHCVAQADLEFLASSNPLTIASQSARITGMTHRARPMNCETSENC